MNLLKRLLGLVLVIGILNIIGFFTLPFIVGRGSRLFMSPNVLLFFKTSVMLCAVYYIVYSGDRLRITNDFWLIFVLLVGLYMPIFFGESYNGIHTAWPIGFIVIDAFSAIGMWYGIRNTVFSQRGHRN